MLVVDFVIIVLFYFRIVAATFVPWLDTKLGVVDDHMTLTQASRFIKKYNPLETHCSSGHFLKCIYFFVLTRDFQH